MSPRNRTASLLLALVWAAAPVAGVASEESWRLDVADWSRPRSGAAVVGMAPLPEVVRAWSAARGKDIAILHAGGEEGELRARELRDWLVALGVPGNRVQLLVGGTDPQSIRFELQDSEVDE